MVVGRTGTPREGVVRFRNVAVGGDGREMVRTERNRDGGHPSPNLVT